MAPETFTYDYVGNLKTKTNGKGTKTLDYDFFAGYRLKTVIEPDGKTVSYTYDANDNPLTQSTNGVTYTFDYDARNRLTNLKAQLDGYTFNIGYLYDTFGRITGINYPGRTSQVSYNYNELDLLKSIPSFINDCTYDEDNKLTAMALSNGITNTYLYDQNDRPTNISAGNMLSLNYTYDTVGNVSQINNDYFGYDGMSRLVWYGNKPKEQISSASGTTWAYDGAGNISSKSTYLNGVLLNKLYYTCDYNNRLFDINKSGPPVFYYTNDNTGARTGKAVYDNGNIKERWSYQYDGESRLTQVSKDGTTVAQCYYDGVGMRYKKVENGKTIYYIYSGPNPIAEFSPSTGQYTYRIYAGKQAIAEETDGVVKFYHKDHLGSTRIITDFSGNKIAEYKYAPYGEKEISTGTGTAYQFTDKTTDESTGLSYFGARFYDPEVGRFITQDPIKAGDNWFAYCNNNPVKYVDPTGLSSYEPGCYTDDNGRMTNTATGEYIGTVHGVVNNHNSNGGVSTRRSSSSSLSTVAYGQAQYTLDYIANKRYKVVGYIEDGYVRLLPKTEILSDVRLYKGLGNVALIVAVVDKGITAYGIVTSNNLSFGQKCLKGGIEVASTVIEYGTGILVGLATAETGPGAFVLGAGATYVTSSVLDSGKNWLYTKWGLD